MNKDEIKNLSFEDALTKLEEIVVQLESGRIKLDDAVVSYEKAMALKNVCDKKLKDAKMKIEKLEVSATGEIKVSPLDGEA